MEHLFYDSEYLVTLKKLFFYAFSSEIRISTKLDSQVVVNTGDFQVSTPNSTLTVANHKAAIGNKSGFIDIRASGTDADIVLDANTVGDNASFLTVNTKGILSAFGNPIKPAFIRLDSDSVNLGKGLMLPGPTLGGKITVTDDSVVLQAGLSKISITPSGIVIQCGLPGVETKFELSANSIAENVLNLTKHQLSAAGHTLESAASNIKITPASLVLGSPVIQAKSDAFVETSSLMATIKANAVASVKGSMSSIN